MARKKQASKPEPEVQEEEKEDRRDEIKIEEPEFLSYKFRWKSPTGWLWKSKVCIAHKYFEENNRMVLYMDNGGIFEIPNWSVNWSDLGKDWAEKVRKQYKDEMEKKGDNEKHKEEA